MSETKQRRSTCGCNEHNTFDSANGSMGMTRVGKYTLVPRSRALASSAVPRRT